MNIIGESGVQHHNNGVPSLIAFSVWNDDSFPWRGIALLNMCDFWQGLQSLAIVAIVRRDTTPHKVVTLHEGIRFVFRNETKWLNDWLSSILPMTFNLNGISWCCQRRYPRFKSLLPHLQCINRLLSHSNSPFLGHHSYVDFHPH